MLNHGYTIQPDPVPAVPNVCNPGRTIDVASVYVANTFGIANKAAFYSSTMDFDGPFDRVFPWGQRLQPHINVSDERIVGAYR